MSACCLLASVPALRWRCVARRTREEKPSFATGPAGHMLAILAILAVPAWVLMVHWMYNAAAEIGIIALARQVATAQLLPLGLGAALASARPGTRHQGLGTAASCRRDHGRTRCAYRALGVRTKIAQPRRRLRILRRLWSPSARLDSGIGREARNPADAPPRR